LEWKEAEQPITATKDPPERPVLFLGTYRQKNNKSGSSDPSGEKSKKYVNACLHQVKGPNGELAGSPSGCGVLMQRRLCQSGFSGFHIHILVRALPIRSWARIFYLFSLSYY
jgi:hypothetical protein